MRIRAHLNYLILGIFILPATMQSQDSAVEKESLKKQASSDQIIKGLPEKVEAYFDFWIGEWEATWDEGEGKKGYGTNYIHPIMGGKALQENFKATKGQNEGFDGISLSIYDQRQKLWKQVWVDNQGNYLDLTGETSGDDRIFRTAVVKKDDKEIVLRMVFKDIKENSFTWDWENSTDGGKSWNLSWRIYYKRKKNS